MIQTNISQEHQSTACDFYLLMLKNLEKVKAVYSMNILLEKKRKVSTKSWLKKGFGHLVKRQFENTFICMDYF